MTPSPHRILCLDSSPARQLAIARALEKAGFQVWTASDAKDAVCMAFGLRFDAVVVDHKASTTSANVWNCLAESQPSLPIIVHSQARDLHSSPARCEGESTPAATPELILAMLTILLSTTPAQNAAVA